MQKIILAFLLLAVGVSGFCVSLSKLTSFIDTDIRVGSDSVHALCLYRNSDSVSDILRVLTRSGPTRIPA
jgi:hypothetical protein